MTLARSRRHGAGGHHAYAKTRFGAAVLVEAVAHLALDQRGGVTRRDLGLFCHRHHAQPRRQHQREPEVRPLEARLSAEARTALVTAPDSGLAPLPASVAEELAAATGITVGTRAAEWTTDEAYVAVPGPGRDAWASIDRATGRIEAERTDRGAVAFLNDLHKGRNTGTAWFWFIDVLALASIIFTITGLLLLQLHARKRPSTWPLVAAGTVVPVIVIVFFLHL